MTEPVYRGWGFLLVFTLDASLGRREKSGEGKGGGAGEDLPRGANQY